MILVDAQLSPTLATWIEHHFGIEAAAVRDFMLRDAADQAIFDFARQRDAIVLTKDADFPKLVHEHGSPPKVIWLTCGNTSNRALKRILAKNLLEALRLLSEGEPLVEIGGA
ncbi:MAG: DUF5615 family PIN-like protein [Planctomycetota bacterium]